MVALPVMNHIDDQCDVSNDCEHRQNKGQMVLVELQFFHLGSDSEIGKHEETPERNESYAKHEQYHGDSYHPEWDQEHSCEHLSDFCDHNIKWWSRPESNWNSIAYQAIALNQLSYETYG